MAEPLLTAIVSIYAAERFMRGCLDDLLAQTLGERLEILVIDACSPEREGEIVREYAQRHPSIRYVRTPTRENTSQAFNRAIGMARGKYLTTANVDDRHHPEFAARMVAALEAHPEFGLVYADSLITETANETFAANTARRRYAWPDYSHATALSCCLFGAQPVWRRDVHARAGQFDPRLVRANDQDMFLRIAWHCGAVHLRETLGLFLARADSMSGKDNRADTLREVLEVMRRYREAMPLDVIFPTLGRFAGDPSAEVAALVEMGNLCALGPYTDATLALDFYRRATQIELPANDAARLRALFANNTACILACAGEPDRALHALRLCADLAEARDNRERFAAARTAGRPPRLRECAFASWPHAVIDASRSVRALVHEGGSCAWTTAQTRLPWEVFEGPDGVAVDTPPDEANAKACLLPTPTPRVASRHVLLVMYGWNDSGGGTILPRQVAEQLAARGHRVSVFYAMARERADLPPYALVRAREAGVELFGLCNRPTRFMDVAAPTREVDDPRVRAVFTELLAELTPDVVHFFNLHNLGMSLPAVAKAHGLPTLLSSNNYWPLCPRLYLASERVELCSGPSADGRKCERCLGQRDTASGHAQRRQAGLQMLDGDVDLHLATSTRVRDLFVANGADPARIRVVHQVPPTADGLWAKTGSQRAVVDVLRRPLRAAFVGSVLPHKGVHVLAQALQTLPRGRVECVALGDVEPGYAAQLRQLDPRGALHLVGAYAQADLAAYLAKVDVVVVPSIWDDCAPLVVAEALAARCPVLGSRIGGIPDFVNDGVTGMLFTPGDAHDLGRCLAAFGHDPGLLGAMQRAIAAPRPFAGYLAELEAVYAACTTAVERRAPTPGGSR